MPNIGLCLTDNISLKIYNLIYLKANPAKVGDHKPT